MLDKPWGEVFKVETVRDYLNDAYLIAILRDMVINKDIWDEMEISSEDLTEQQKELYDSLDNSISS